MEFEFKKCAIIRKFKEHYKRRDLSFMKELVREIYYSLRDRRLDIDKVYLEQTVVTNYVFDTYYNEAIETDRGIYYEICITGYFTRDELVKALENIYVKPAASMLRGIVDIYDIKIREIPTTFRVVNPEHFSFL